MENYDIQKKIFELIQKDLRVKNQEETQEILRNCGILDECNCVVPEYKGIITEIKD